MPCCPPRVRPQVVVCLCFLLSATLTPWKSPVQGQTPTPRATAHRGSSPSVGALVVHPLDPRRMYLVSAAGVLSRSEDSGDSWQRLNPESGGGPWATLAVWDHDPLELWVLDRQGNLLHSDDGGNRFELRSQGRLDATVRLTVDPDNPWTLYADGCQGVQRSRDGGATWQFLWEGTFGRLALDRDSADTLYVATCLARGDGRFPCGAVRLDRSRDAGVTWEQVAVCDLLEGLEAANLEALAAAPATVPIHRLIYDRELYVATWQGLFEPMTTVGSCPRRSRRTEVFDVDVVVNGQSRRPVWTERGGLSIQRGRGKRFLPLLGERPPVALTIQSQGVFVATDDGAVLAHGGDTWRFLRRPLQADTRLHDASAPPAKQRRRAGPAPAARPARDPLLGRHLDNHVGAVLFHPHAPGTLFAGTLKGVFVSEDFGLTWQHRSVGLWPSDVHALAFDVSLGVLYAGTHGGGVYASADRGRSWERRSSGLHGGVVSALWVDSQSSATLMALVSGGLYISRDGARRWRPLRADRNWSLDQELRHVIPIDLAQSSAEEVVVVGHGEDPKWMSMVSGSSPKFLTAGPSKVCGDGARISGPGSTLEVGKQLLWDEARERLYLATNHGLWSLPWGQGRVDESLADKPGQSNRGLGRLGLRCGAWTRHGGQHNIQGLAVDGRDGTVFAATGRGLWRLRPGDDWQGLNLPDPTSAVHSVAVDGSASGALAVGTDQGAVAVSLDDGATWRWSQLPSPPVDRRVRKALGPLPPRGKSAAVNESQAVADASGINTSRRRIESHLGGLPQTAHRQRLRWLTELWGRSGRSKETSQIVLGLSEAAAAVRFDAASELRSSGLRELHFAGDGRWMIGQYLFDDGVATHDELRIFDLRDAPWRDVEDHGRIGARSTWKVEHDLAFEPSHLVPTWQLVDAGDLLASSSPAQSLVTWQRNGDLRLWRLQSSQRSEGLTGDDTVRRPSSHRLAGERADGAVPMGRPLAEFSPDGRWLAIVNESGSSRLGLWYLPEDGGGPQRQPLAAAAFDRIADLEFHPSAPWLVLADVEGELTVAQLRVEKPPVPKTVAGAGASLKTLVFSPDGRWMTAVAAPPTAASPRRQRLLLWPWREASDAVLGKPHELLSAPRLENPTFDAEGRWLAVGEGEDGHSPHLWDVQGTEPAPLPGIGTDLRFLSFLGGDAVLVQGRETEVLQLGARVRRQMTLSHSVDAGAVLGGRGVWNRAVDAVADAADQNLAHAATWLSVFPPAANGPNVIPRPRRVDIKPPRSAVSLHMDGNIVVVAEGGGQLELWRLGAVTERARIQVGRYDVSHPDLFRGGLLSGNTVDSHRAFLRLLSLLQQIDWITGDRRQTARQLCHLAGGPPDPATWHRVLRGEPYGPFCGAVSAVSE